MSWSYLLIDLKTEKVLKRYSFPSDAYVERLWERAVTIETVRYYNMNL